MPGRSAPFGGVLNLETRNMTRSVALFLACVGCVTVTTLLSVVQLSTAQDKIKFAPAETKDLTLAEATKLGMKVELVEPKPKVVYATLKFVDEPKDALLVIQNNKGDGIANTSMAIHDNSVSAYLAEEYVARSYFYITPNSGKTFYRFSLK